MTQQDGKCDCCDGSGRHPVADYLVASKGTTIACGACNGTGNVRVAAAEGGEGVSDPEGLLADLAARSRRKLMTPVNLAKGSWIGMSDEQVRGRIFDEIRELLSALRDGSSWDEIADEAADVYHFACMGADPDRKEARA